MNCSNQKNILILQLFIKSLQHHPLPDTRERIHIAIKLIENNLLEGFKL